MIDTLFLVKPLILKKKRVNKMIKYNESVLEKISSWEDNDIYVVADFDRTITSSTSVTSWGILTASKRMSNEFIQKGEEIYNYYRPIEIDPTIPFSKKNQLMIEWWNKIIIWLGEAGLNKNDIDNLINESNLITFREGAKEFFQSLAVRNIPIIIISAGLGDAIKHFLKQNGVMFSNVHIVSNFLSYENGVVKGVKGYTIHSLNKSADLLSKDEQEAIEGRSHIILLGDQISDIYMVSDAKRAEALKIAFIPKGNYNEGYKDSFDVLCPSDTSFADLSKEFTLFSLDKMKR